MADATVPPDTPLPRPALRLVGGTDIAGLADDDPHPEWLAEAPRLWTLMHAPRFRPGVELARTAEWARFVELTQREVGGAPVLEAGRGPPR